MSCACGTAPVMLINDVLHENLTVERVDELIAKLPGAHTIITIRPLPGNQATGINSEVHQQDKTYGYAGRARRAVGTVLPALAAGIFSTVGGGGGRDGGAAEPAGGWAVCSFDGSKPYHSKPAGWGVYFCQLRKGCFFDQAGIAGGGDGGGASRRRIRPMCSFRGIRQKA